MKLIAQIKLLPSCQQAQLLKATLQRANAACNAISDYAWQHHCFNKYTLQKALYTSLRADFALSAQMTIRCLSKVADGYKLDHNTKRTLQPTGAIAYDSRILSFQQ